MFKYKYINIYHSNFRKSHLHFSTQKNLKKKFKQTVLMKIIKGYRMNQNKIRYPSILFFGVSVKRNLWRICNHILPKILFQNYRIIISFIFYLIWMLRTHARFLSLDQFFLTETHDKKRKRTDQNKFDSSYTLFYYFRNNLFIENGISRPESWDVWGASSSS